MKDALHDIVKYTSGIGIELIKVTGDHNETIINGLAEDKTVILDAKFHNIIPDFQGVFGMPNLNKLNVILNIPEYREDAKLSIARQDDGDGNLIPCGIDFENRVGDFKNNFRFMVANVITEKLKTVKFRGVTWDVEIEPSVNAIQRMRFQTQANSEEYSFIAKTNKNNLEFHFGVASTHAGNFVFHQGINGKLTANRSWPVAVFNTILALPGDKMLRFSDQGAAQITVDSGLALYSYTIPALTK
jgi:hypothetical protein